MKTSLSSPAKKRHQKKIKTIMTANDRMTTSRLNNTGISFFLPLLSAKPKTSPIWDQQEKKEQRRKRPTSKRDGQRE